MSSVKWRPFCLGLNVLRMWNRPSIPCVMCVFTALINAKEDGIQWNKGKWTLFYSCFGNCRLLAYKISTWEVCMIWWKPIAACNIYCKSPSRWPDGLTTLDWLTVHGATLSACIWESAYKWSHMGRGTVQQTVFACLANISKAQKVMQTNRILK